MQQRRPHCFNTYSKGWGDAVKEVMGSSLSARFCTAVVSKPVDVVDGVEVAADGD
jgi:hypothetical protein